MDKTKLSAHFLLSEFIRLDKYPMNIPSAEAVANMAYGCKQLLEPARAVVGPIIINSGFRNKTVNRRVGGRS